MPIANLNPNRLFKSTKHIIGTLNRNALTGNAQKTINPSIPTNEAFTSQYMVPMLNTSIATNQCSVIFQNPLWLFRINNIGTNATNNNGARGTGGQAEHNRTPVSKLNTHGLRSAILTIPCTKITQVIEVKVTNLK